MRKKQARLVLLITTVIVIIIAAIIWTNFGSQSPQVAIGVKAGDTFTYELQGLWESNDPNATISNSILQLNMTESYQVIITNVSNPDVSIHTIWRFKNGTKIEANDKVDIETGASSGFWAIYAANLNEGQSGHAIGPEPHPISSTVNKQYSSGERETNLVLLNAQFQNEIDPSRVYTDTRAVQFDKKTGMLVELRDESEYNIPAMTEIIVWKLIASNVWAVA
jgi:hypothetical protein